MKRVSLLLTLFFLAGCATTPDRPLPPSQYPDRYLFRADSGGKEMQAILLSSIPSLRQWQDGKIHTGPVECTKGFDAEAYNCIFFGKNENGEPYAYPPRLEGSPAKQLQQIITKAKTAVGPQFHGEDSQVRDISCDAHASCLIFFWTQNGLKPIGS